MLDEERRARLQRAGERLRQADQERGKAVAELKAAMSEADGDSSPDEAAQLTGLSAVESEILLGGDAGHGD